MIYNKKIKHKHIGLCFVFCCLCDCLNLDIDKKYYFYIKDHLGNNRVVADAAAEVVQSNQYYPFGLSYANGIGSGKQPYKYSGKEQDNWNGLNIYDFEARWMNTVIPMFTTPDPLSEKMYSWSPYTYCFNNPMMFVDKNGEWPDWAEIKANIKRVGHAMKAIASDPKAILNYSTNPNWEEQTRISIFGTIHPKTATAIGFDDGSNNISSIAARFGEALSGGDMQGRGNAIRHGVWQAMITIAFDKWIAEEAGNIHETNPLNINLTKRQFDGDRWTADDTADMLNNQESRDYISNIGLQDKVKGYFSTKEVVKQILNHYKENGMWEVKQYKNGNFSIVKTQLTENEYKNNINILKGLNHNGK